MRHLVLTIIAIAIAGVAAVAATTAMLNAPLRIGPATGSTPTPAQPGQTPAPASKEIPDAPPPKGAEPQPATPAGAEPAGAEPADAKPPAEGETPEESRQGSLRRHRARKICRPICNTTPMPASVSRRTPRS